MRTFAYVPAPRPGQGRFRGRPGIVLMVPVDDGEKTGRMTSAGDVRHILGRISTVWRVAYGAESRRRLAWSVVAVPRAVTALVRAARRPGRVRALTTAALAVPVAVASSALTATLAFLGLINVLAYPFRAWLGLPGRTEDIWASRHADSWGGPTLAGAWATHAVLWLLLGVPVMAWAVRGLTGLQWRLTGHSAAVAGPSSPGRVPAPSTRRRPAPRPAASRTAEIPPATAAASPARVTVPQPFSGAAVGAATAPAGRRRARWRRVGAVLAAVALLVASSLTAHAAGIGDNLLWAPRDAVSSVALAVTLAPVAALLLLTRTPWWRISAR